jgi:hypothetical protein
VLAVKNRQHKLAFGLAESSKRKLHKANLDAKANLAARKNAFYTSVYVRDAAIGPIEMLLITSIFLQHQIIQI